VLDLLILRERKHFWSSQPSRFLLLTVGADLLLVFLIWIFGLPGVAPIKPIEALTVVIFASIIAFLINDPIKVFLIRRFWPG